MACSEKEMNDIFPLYLPLEARKYANSKEGFQFLCIKLISLDVPDTLKENGGQFKCKAALYDIAHQQFVGNMWTGKAFSEKSGKILINETIYFYTSVAIKSLKFSIELMSSNGDREFNKVIAWTAFDLLDMKDTTSKAPIQYRIPLYHGTSAALFFMAGSLEGLNHVEHATGFELSLSMAAHPVLMRLMHLIPENYLVGSSDVIPGLFPSSTDNITHDRLSRPQLQKCCTLVLSSVTLKVSPSVEKFEAEILKKMLSLKMSTESDQLKIGEPTIVQRHLQVGVHNGLCFIQESDSYRLLVEPVFTQTPNKRMHRRSSSLGSIRNECLVVRSDVKIPNVPDDPKVMIVFVVEYAISFHNNSSDMTSASSLGRSPSSSVTLLWGYSPLSVVKEQSTVSLSLTNSPVSCPNKTLFLRVSETHSFELMFSVLHDTKKRSKKETSKSQSHLQSLDYSSASPENMSSLSVPSHLHRLSSSTSDLAQKRISSHPILQHLESVPATTSRPISSHPIIRHETNEIYQNSSMEEVSIIPTSMPIIPEPDPTFQKPRSFPRTLYAKLHSPEFPPIYDRQGQVPYKIDTTLPYVVQEAREISSSPQGCDIVFHFLALSGVQPDVPESLFFTFQFYRFPPVKTESLSLRRESGNELISSQLRILTTSSFNNDSYGYQITYYIDPSELNPGEYRYFLLALVKGTMQIDLWDSKTLLYFGTVIVPLKYLCRQGREAVCTTIDLDIKHSEFPDDAPGPTIPFSHLIKGHLHFRMASIKVPLSTRSLSKIKDFSIHDSVIITKKAENRSELQTVSHVITKASPILETNKELARLMASRCIVTSSAGNPIMSEERRRKLARMEAVRNSLGKTSSPYSSSKDMQNLFKERQRDLLVIESYIEKHKKDMIHSLLKSSVTSEKILHPALGEKSYFEFELVNPYDSELNIYVSWSCPKLRIVIDKDEWLFLRKQFGVSQKSEDNFISTSKNTSATIFLRGKESVLVPFLYQNIFVEENIITSSKILKASSGHHFTSDILSITTCMAPSEVKVSFQTIDQTLIAALCLKIQPLPPSSLSQAFRFLSPEHSLFQKNFMLNNFSRKPYILCSDSAVVCDFLQHATWETSDSVHIFLKAPTGSTGKMRNFFVFIYEDQYQISPKQTWAVCICPVLRIDLSCAAGQISRSSLVLRGNHASRLVHCSSDSAELMVHSDEPFVLTPCTVQELAIKLRCLLPGVGYFRVSVVDQGIKEILHLWLLVIVCQKPFVSKAFQVHLHLGTEAIKRISYSNPHVEAKQYEVLVSHPNILQLREDKFIAPPKKSHALGLYFPPQDSAFTETLFLYICDESGKSEETFCIKVNCK